MAKADPKAIRILTRLIEEGYTGQDAVLALTVDDMLAIRGITVADISLINALQKAIRGKNVIAFFVKKEPTETQNVDKEEPYGRE